MTARLLDGKQIAAEMLQNIAQRVEALKQRGIVPGLAVILVGESPASQIYVRNKQVACDTVGIMSETITLPESTTQQELEAVIENCNQNPAIHGILVQLPLPESLDETAALARIAPEKDVDGFHYINAGRLMNGEEGVAPCTPKGVMAMLQKTGIDLDGKEAVILGRSNIVGKPMALMLLKANCTVTMCHSRTQDIAFHTRRADILVAAVGQPHFLTGDMVKPGAVVIDVGINRVNGKVVGDVNFDEVSQVASWISPVPGGVGRMTIAMLLENTLVLAEEREHLHA